MPTLTSTNFETTQQLCACCYPTSHTTYWNKMMQYQRRQVMMAYSDELFNRFCEMAMGNFITIDMKQIELTHIACTFVDDVLVSGATIIDRHDHSHATIQCFCTRKSMHGNGHGFSMIKFIENHYIIIKDVHVVVTNDSREFYEHCSLFSVKNRSSGCCESVPNCGHFVFKSNTNDCIPSKYHNNN